jgi:nucleotide-binding universal stress UspA family protein
MADARLLPATAAPAVFHPSDFSDASEIAFAHALKIALASKATLHMLHVSDPSRVPWEEFPGVRDTLERWGLIPADSPRRAVTRLGIEVRKVVTHDRDPVKASLGFLKRHPADVVVLAVHQREGRMRWFQKAVGEPIAYGSGQITLFVPHGVEGFVSRATGAVSLRNILIPLAHKPSPQPALDATARFVRNLQVDAGTVTLLHVGPDAAPPVRCPDVPGWTWRRMSAIGDPAERILWAAGDLAADLIVMTTDGPEGFLDGLRGTTSARVLNKARCPVANLPVGARLAP